MEIRAKGKYEGLLILALAVVAVIVYVGRTENWFGPIQFSSGFSMIVVLAIAGTLIWVLIRTLGGKPAQRLTVFLYVALAVTLPLFMTLTQKMEETPEVTLLRDGLAAVPPGSKVLVAFDYDPGSAPELQPMAESFFRYCFDHNLKMIVMGLWPQGPQQASLALDHVLSEPKYASRQFTYGVDYVNLGFQSGNEFVIQRMGSDFKSMFPFDYRGTPYDSLPLVHNVRNFSNVEYVFNLSAGYPGTKEWVMIGVDRYGFKLGAGNTAVQTTGMYPYIRSGQLLGILGGMSGAAEFEVATHQLAKGTKFMLSQSFAHVVLVIFIIIGNVAYFMTERGKSKRNQGQA
jgi:hypothetical protein